MANTIERDRLVARAINEMRRMINLIQTWRGYYYYGGGEMTDQEKLASCKQRLERLIEEFQKL